VIQSASIDENSSQPWTPPKRTTGQEGPPRESRYESWSPSRSCSNSRRLEPSTGCSANFPSRFNVKLQPRPISFGRIPFILHSILKSFTRSITKSGAFESIARTASSSNLSVATMSNYGSLVTTTPFMTTICSDNLTPGTWRGLWRGYLQLALHVFGVALHVRFVNGDLWFEIWE